MDNRPRQLEHVGGKTMTQELTRYETAPQAPVVTNEQLDLVRRTVARDATPAELELYMYDCQRHGVHPLDKLLHFTKRSGKYTPITSIDLLRSRASDTGDLAGIDDPQHRGEPMTVDFTASVTVYRMVQGIRCPFTATARWTEYKPADGQDHMWRKMPYLMLGKCAEALALRKAFPRQLAGLYAKEEMDQAGDTDSGSAPKATEKQINMLNSLWRRGEFDGSLDEWTANAFGHTTNDLTKAQASEAIETLQAEVSKAS